MKYKNQMMLQSLLILKVLFQPSSLLVSLLRGIAFSRFRGFETGAPCIAQPDLLLMTLLPQRPGLTFTYLLLIFLVSFGSSRPWVYFVAQADLALAVMLLSQSPKCWNDRSAPPCWLLVYLLKPLLLLFQCSHYCRRIYFLFQALRTEFTQ